MAEVYVHGYVNKNTYAVSYFNDNTQESSESIHLPESESVTNELSKQFTYLMDDINDFIREHSAEYEAFKRDMKAGKYPEFCDR